MTAYLDIAEVHALNHELMYMKDWLENLDALENVEEKLKKK